MIEEAIDEESPAVDIPMPPADILHTGQVVCHLPLEVIHIIGLCGIEALGNRARFLLRRNDLREMPQRRAAHDRLRAILELRLPILIRQLLDFSLHDQRVRLDPLHDALELFLRILRDNTLQILADIRIVQGILLRELPCHKTDASREAFFAGHPFQLFPQLGAKESARHPVLRHRISRHGQIHRIHIIRYTRERNLCILRRKRETLHQILFRQ